MIKEGFQVKYSKLKWTDEEDSLHYQHCYVGIFSLTQNGSQCAMHHLSVGKASYNCSLCHENHAPK